MQRPTKLVAVDDTQKSGGVIAPSKLSIGPSTRKTVKELQAFCVEKGLAKTGTKDVLLARIAEYNKRQNVAIKTDYFPLTELPVEIVTNIIWSFLEICDIVLFAEVNRGMRQLLLDTMKNLMKTRPRWETQELIVWMVRRAPKDKIEVLFPLDKEIDEWAKRVIALYLTERNIEHETLNNESTRSKRLDTWEIARELLVIIRNRCWRTFRFMAIHITAQYISLNFIYLGELLAGHDALSLDALQYLVTLSEEKTEMSKLLRYILLAYIKSEKWTLYDKIFTSKQQKLRTLYAKRLAPYLLPQEYERASNGLAITKSALGDEIYSRQLYRALPQEMKELLNIYTLYRVATPEEACNQLQLRGKWNGITTNAVRYAYSFWADEVESIQAGEQSREIDNDADQDI